MERPKPLVSVIIPCYNQAQYLKETVLSALNSDYSALEIIIVNDGSTDGSKELAEQLANQYQEIKVLNQQNQGVTVARNRGIESSKGVFILCLDGDDLISKNYLEEAANTLTKRPEVKVVYCKALKFNKKKKKLWKLKPFTRNLLARDNMIFVSALFRKSDWEACGGFSEDMNYGREDWEFWIKMLKDGGEVIQLPFVGFFYRLTPSSKRKKTGTNEKKRARIAYLNSKHQDFFERELNGPLRFQRTWSKPYNTLLKFLGLPLRK
ncbi:glycosyltransferase family A protein [Algoriphagus sp. SE2]|uniref:glycosyltransferase family 2 protein n=1 Tax=Algoriphagus sp. SE2 TaxID=3141536 RepID=UPI0031CD8363